MQICNIIGLLYSLYYNISLYKRVHVFIYFFVKYSYSLILMVFIYLPLCNIMYLFTRQMSRYLFIE